MEKMLNINKVKLICEKRTFSFKSLISKTPVPRDRPTQIRLETYNKFKQSDEGNNPFNVKIIKREADGTLSKPKEIPSAFDCRLIGCICNAESEQINWMWLHKGKLKKCDCGYYFKLIKKVY